MKQPVKVAVLVSGGGTNLQAIIDYSKDGNLTNGNIVKVISKSPRFNAVPSFILVIIARFADVEPLPSS